jgi:putative FmdB family regulatory protein
MPMYGFRCPQCGLEFEVARPMRLAGDPATCPMDGTVSQRIFAPVATIGGAKQEQKEPPAPKPQSGGFSHFGHSHGPGVAAHSHGGFRPQPPRSSGDTGA